MNRRLALAVFAAAALSACVRQPELSDPVARGERDFRGLGCVKCHQIGSEGHAWGPDLTLVGFRKSPQWLDMWLKNPHAWNQKTVMPNFHLKDETRADLVAYLSAQKGQAWATAPWRTEAAKALAPIERGQMIFNDAGCVACHGQNGYGGYPNNNVAGGLIPSLTHVADSYSDHELHEKIKLGANPIAVDASKPAPMIRMPKWGEELKSDEIDALVAYLMSLEPKSSSKSSASDDGF